ncbi:MAG: hypothetical protein H7338_25120 [Candidatus Sericytochromatia bacterium]|nr:hypothetical protein [Candidatus Sericytochromatia bacterium]
MAVVNALAVSNGDHTGALSLFPLAPKFEDQLLHHAALVKPLIAIVMTDMHPFAALREDLPCHKKSFGHSSSPASF